MVVVVEVEVRLNFKLSCRPITTTVRRFKDARPLRAPGLQRDRNGCVCLVNAWLEVRHCHSLHVVYMYITNKLPSYIRTQILARGIQQKLAP